MDGHILVKVTENTRDLKSGGICYLGEDNSTNGCSKQMFKEPCVLSGFGIESQDDPKVTYVTNNDTVIDCSRTRTEKQCCQDGNYFSTEAYGSSTVFFSIVKASGDAINYSSKDSSTLQISSAWAPWSTSQTWHWPLSRPSFAISSIDMFVRHRLPNFVVRTSWVGKQICLDIVFMLAWGIERDKTAQRLIVVLRVCVLIFSRNEASLSADGWTVPPELLTTEKYPEEQH